MDEFDRRRENLLSMLGGVKGFEEYRSSWYKDFLKAEMEASTLGRYERACKLAGRVLPLPPPDSLSKKLDKAILVSGLKTSPREVWSLGILSFVVSLGITGLFLSIHWEPLLLSLPLFMGYVTTTYPLLRADMTRIIAGNESLQAIIYMGIYLAINPVLVNAVAFAASHLHGPLGRDLKRVMWAIESNKVQTIREATQPFIEKWKEWSNSFVHSFNLLQEVERHPRQEERLSTIEEAINNIQEDTFNTMKEYALEMRSPAQMIQAIGILLPLLGLVMFPMISTFLSQDVKISSLAIGYTFLLPIFLYTYIYKLIGRRPGTFSHSSAMSGLKPDRTINIGGLGIPILPLVVLVGILLSIPAVNHFFGMWQVHETIFSMEDQDAAAEEWRAYTISRYEASVVLRDAASVVLFGWGLAIAVGGFFYLRSRRPKKIEDEVRALEQELEVGLFQLAKSLKKNMPLEDAMRDVISSYEEIGAKDSRVAGLFKTILNRLITTQHSIYHIMFGPGGVMENFPSLVLRDAMRLLFSTIDRGVVFAGRAIENVVGYLKRLREVEMLVKEVVSEVSSSLQVQAIFIAPVISAVVASQSVFIVQVIRQIALTLESIQSSFGLGTTVSASNELSSSLSFLNLETIVPPTILMAILVVYMVEVVVIMSFFKSGIDNGFDEINRDYLIGNNVMRAMLLFTVVLVVMLAFFQPMIESAGGGI